MFHTKSRKILLRGSDLNRVIHKLRRTHTDFEHGDLKGTYRLLFPFKLKYELNLSCKFILGHVRKIAECNCQLLHVCLCVHLSVYPSGPHWTDFHEILYLSIFRKICQKDSSFIKNWQEKRALYMKTYVHFWSYLTHFFLKWEIFRRNL